MTPEKNDASVLVRLPSDLKFALQREAYAHGRRITAEINMRLRASFPGGVPQMGEPLKPAIAAEPGAPGWNEQELLDAFRRMPAELQSALLSLARAVRPQP